MNTACGADTYVAVMPSCAVKQFLDTPGVCNRDNVSGTNRIALIFLVAFTQSCMLQKLSVSRYPADAGLTDRKRKH